MKDVQIMIKYIARFCELLIIVIILILLLQKLWGGLLYG